MGFAAFLRNLIGAASREDLDAARVAATSASDARLSAQDARQLLLRSKEDHDLVVTRVEDELSRLSARVEAMPQMREQLETFVQSLGRTMTQAADRLEHVDDRLHHVEQQSRAQTEILAMSRAELDRQGRALGGIETQMQSLESAIAQLVAAADRTQALLRDVEERKVRTANAVWIAISAAGIAVVAAVISALR